MEVDDPRNSAWIRGEVPWTGPGLAEAFAALTPTRAAPPPVPLPGSSGTESATHEILWLIGRYGDASGRAHALRLFQVRRFLMAYRGRLVGEGLIHPAGNAISSSDGFVLSPGLTHALATLPYSRHIWDSSTGRSEGSLDVDDVIAAAHAADNAERSGP